MWKTLTLCLTLLAVGGCGKPELHNSDAETQASEHDPAVVPAAILAPANEPPATRCAITVYDRSKVSKDDVWAAQQNPALLSSLDSHRLTYFARCLTPDHPGERGIGSVLLNDRATGRIIDVRGSISNDPARVEVKLLSLGSQFMPSTGSILVGRNQATIAESTNYIYEIRCNLRVAECSSTAYPSKYPENVTSFGR